MFLCGLYYIIIFRFLTKSQTTTGAPTIEVIALIGKV